MRPKSLWIMLLACAAAAFAAFAYPMYVIRPFRAQGATELLIALFVKRWALPIGIAAAVSALVCGAVLWRKLHSTAIRILSAVVVLLTGVFAALANVNVYEMMFHRIGTPQSIAGSAAQLEPEDMVLAVEVEGQGRAYPIRMMGYHHIVNDRIGATPIAATY